MEEEAVMGNRDRERKTPLMANEKVDRNFKEEGNPKFELFFIWVNFVN